MINIKKTPVLLLVLFCVSSAYAQSEKESFEYFTKDEMIDYLMNSGAQIDSLKKEVIEPLNGRILDLISSHREENSALNDDLDEQKRINSYLIQEIRALESALQELEKSKVKEERDLLDAEVSSLNIDIDALKIKIAEKEGLIAKEIKQALKKEQNAKKAGKEEVLNRIIQTYQKPFDSLIKNSTLKTVELDISIIRGEISGTEKLFELKKYFKSEQFLSEKFDKDRVATELNNIEKLDKESELVERLSMNITRYKELNEELIKTIKRILLEDKILTALNSDMQSQKKGKIFSELASFIYNYEFNFSDFPYLSDIVLELISKKQRDANKDITYLLEKL